MGFKKNYDVERLILLELRTMWHTDQRLLNMWEVIAPKVVFSEEFDFSNHFETENIVFLFSEDTLAYPLVTSILRMSQSGQRQIRIRKPVSSVKNVLLAKEAKNSKLLLAAKSNFAVILAEDTAENEETTTDVYVFRLC